MNKFRAWVIPVISTVIVGGAVVILALAIFHKVQLSPEMENKLFGLLQVAVGAALAPPSPPSPPAVPSSSDQEDQ